MIGKFDKKRKEQKKILKELESIKSLLDDGELIDDDYSALAETAIRKSADSDTATPPQESTQPEESATHIDDLDDFLIDDDPDIDLDTHSNAATETPEIPVLQEMVMDEEPLATSLAPGALPGQQSLFEASDEDSESIAEKVGEEASSKSSEAAPEPIEAAAEIAEPSPKSKPAPPPPAKPKTTENPFLPKHIKDRLNGTVDVPAYAQPNQTVRSPYIPPTFTPGTHEAKSSDTLSPGSLNNLEQQEIIDALINEFMPQIESKLRLRLSKILAKSSTK